MAVTGTVLAAAANGALVGVVGGVMSLLVGFSARENKKGLIGLLVCVLAGALGGMYAVIPAVGGTLFAIARARSQRDKTEKGTDLVFKHGPVLVLLMLAGIPVVVVLSIIVLGLAVYGIAFADRGPTFKMQAAFLGFIGVGSGWLAWLGVRQWYVPFYEYTLTEDGVTATCRSSSHFLPWSALINAKHRTLAKQIDLKFEGNARRVVLSNVDFDPEQAMLLRAVALIERVTGRPVEKSRF